MKPSPQPDFETRGNEFLDNSHLGFLLLGEEAEIRVVRERSSARAARSTAHRGVAESAHLWDCSFLAKVANGCGCPSSFWPPSRSGRAQPLPSHSSLIPNFPLEAFPLPNSCQERPGTGYITQVFDWSFNTGAGYTFLTQPLHFKPGHRCSYIIVARISLFVNTSFQKWRHKRVRKATYMSKRNWGKLAAPQGPLQTRNLYWLLYSLPFLVWRAKSQQNASY